MSHVRWVQPAWVCPAMIAGMSSKNPPRITRNNGIIPPSVIDSPVYFNFNGEKDDQGRDFAATFEYGSKLEAEPVLKNWCCGIDHRMFGRLPGRWRPFRFLKTSRKDHESPLCRSVESPYKRYLHITIMIYWIYCLLCIYIIYLYRVIEKVYI